jgi:hypothetical protein
LPKLGKSFLAVVLIAVKADNFHGRARRDLRGYLAATPLQRSEFGYDRSGIKFARVLTGSKSMSALGLGEIDMEIKVTFDRGKFVFSPDPAVVKRGSLVNWNFQAIGIAYPKLEWTVYFSKGTPFRQGIRFVAGTSEVRGQHAGASPPMTAEDPGDYKYGVRLVDTANQKTLGDDDPRLIVE